MSLIKILKSPLVLDMDLDYKCRSLEKRSHESRFRLLDLGLDLDLDLAKKNTFFLINKISYFENQF